MCVYTQTHSQNQFVRICPIVCTRAKKICHYAGVYRGVTIIITDSDGPWGIYTVEKKVHIVM